MQSFYSEQYVKNYNEKIESIKKTKEYKIEILIQNEKRLTH